MVIKANLNKTEKTFSIKRLLDFEKHLKKEVLHRLAQTCWPLYARGWGKKYWFFLIFSGFIAWLKKWLGLVKNSFLFYLLIELCPVDKPSKFCVPEGLCSSKKKSNKNVFCREKTCCIFHCNFEIAWTKEMYSILN